MHLGGRGGGGGGGGEGDIWSIQRFSAHTVRAEARARARTVGLELEPEPEPAPRFLEYRSSETGLSQE